MAYTTIDNPELYFQVKLYTGTGSAASITLDGSEDMQPDLVWGKGRSVANLHALFDAVRGTGKALYSDRNNAEENQAQGVTSFDSNGFSIGTLGDLNADTKTFVAWCWKANGSGSSNTDGSINIQATEEAQVLSTEKATTTEEVPEVITPEVITPEVITEETPPHQKNIVSKSSVDRLKDQLNDLKTRLIDFAEDGQQAAVISTWVAVTAPKV